MEPHLTVTLDGEQLVGWIVGAAALLAAIAYLARFVRRTSQRLYAILRIVERELDAGDQSEPVKTVVQRELTNNHGSSIKDDVDGIAVAVGALSRQVDDIDERLTTHLNERKQQS